MTNLITELGYLGFEVSELDRRARSVASTFELASNPSPAAPDAQVTQLLQKVDEQCSCIWSHGADDDCAFAGWRVADIAAVRSFSKRLTLLGIRYLWGSEDELALRGAQRMLHFEDPEGNRHEVYCTLRPDTTNCTSKVPSDGVVATACGRDSIVYEASDVVGVAAFAQHVLGLHVSDRAVMKLAAGETLEVVFFGTDKRQHLFGLAQQSAVSRSSFGHPGGRRCAIASDIARVSSQRPGGPMCAVCFAPMAESCAMEPSP